MSPLAVAGLPGLSAAAQLRGPLALAAVATSQVQSRRNITAVSRVGRGGRSSVNGITATVFGATGFVGRYLVNYLGKKGTQMVIPVRGDELHFRHLRQMGDVGQIFFPDYGLRDYASIQRAVKYSDVVFNLVGRDYYTRNFSLDDVHVEGARQIAKACREAGVERLIHVSALGADPASPSKYMQSKYMGELAVKEEFPGATIVRPAKIYGGEDRFFKYIALRQDIFLSIIPNARKAAKKWPVYCIDVGHALGNCIEDAKAPGTTYEFIGPKQMTNEEIIKFFLRMSRNEGIIIQPPGVVYRGLGAWLGYWLQDPFVHRESVMQEGMDEIPTGLPGIPDLGVELSPLRKVGIHFLRGYRPHELYDEHIAEDDAHATA